MFTAKSGITPFMVSPLMPCSYLDNRLESRLFTDLRAKLPSIDSDQNKDQPNQLYDTLIEGGFRRSGMSAYIPVCPSCDACVSVRIRVQNFKPSRSQKRILARNAELILITDSQSPSEAQYQLFNHYIRTRHDESDMADITRNEYDHMIIHSPIDSKVYEWHNSNDNLIAACLVDQVKDGFSAVYSFFEPQLDKNSLGTFMVLSLIEKAKQIGIKYIYLGYWIKNCNKMNYKSRFASLERLTPSGWVEF